MALFEHFLNLNLGVFELLNFVSSLRSREAPFLLALTHSGLEHIVVFDQDG